MDGTRQVRLYQSLVRPHLIMGAERQATIYNAFSAMIIYFMTMNVPGIIAAVLSFSIVQTILRILAKNDAQLIEIVARARKWQDVYKDSASIFAPTKEIPSTQEISVINQALSLFIRKKETKHA